MIISFILRPESTHFLHFFFFRIRKYMLCDYCCVNNIIKEYSLIWYTFVWVKADTFYKACSFGDLQVCVINLHLKLEKIMWNKYGKHLRISGWLCLAKVYLFWSKIEYTVHINPSLTRLFFGPARLKWDLSESLGTDVLLQLL